MPSVLALDREYVPAKKINLAVSDSAYGTPATRIV
jgi:hypothetical protein